MTAYAIYQVKITDPSWLAEYSEPTAALVAKHGGKYLAKSPKIEITEGDAEAPSAVAILEFPNADAARAFADDPDYAPLKQLRNSGSVSTAMIVDAG